MDEPQDLDQWKPLLQEEASRLDIHLEILQDLFPRIEGEATAENLDTSLLSAARFLAATLVASGLDCCDAERNRIDTLWPRLIPALRATLPKRRGLAIKGAVDYINISQCAGREVPAAAAALVEPTIERLTDLLDLVTHSDRRTLALTALAFGRDDLVPKFAAGGKLPRSFKPGQTFDLNIRAFTRYLAVAVEHGAEAEDVEPAWREFVALFPQQLASESLGWVGLFTAARIMMVHFEKRDVGEVAQALHDFVREQE